MDGSASKKEEGRTDIVVGINSPLSAGSPRKMASSKFTGEI